MRPRFDLTELGLVAVFSLLLGATAVFSWSAHFDGIRPYRQRYATKVSQNGEEWLIRHFFQDRRNGLFVDVGANHFRDGSNTYFLETGLGWSGLAIDPQSAFAANYAQHRPRTRYLQLFVSDRTGTIPFFLPINPRRHGVAGADGVYVQQAGGPATSEMVPTTTLDTILESADLARFDFLSMDIERHEPKALAGFTIGRYRPALVCIEAHQPVRQQILDYFAQHDYVLVGDYLHADAFNLWFMPLAAPPGRSSHP